MKIPKGFFIDVTSIPLEDRLKFFPQMENNPCRMFLERNKYCFIVNIDNEISTYSSSDKRSSEYHRHNILATGLKECFIDSLGGL